MIIKQGHCNFLADGPGSNVAYNKVLTNSFNNIGKKYFERVLDSDSQNNSYGNNVFLYHPHDADFW